MYTVALWIARALRTVVLQRFLSWVCFRFLFWVGFFFFLSFLNLNVLLSYFWYLLYVYEHLACLWLHYMHAWCLWMPDVGIESPKRGVTDGRKPLRQCHSKSSQWHFVYAFLYIMQPLFFQLQFTGEALQAALGTKQGKDTWSWSYRYAWNVVKGLANDILS